MISRLTGKNFLFDDRVRGRVTVVSPTPVTPDEAYRVFEAILQVNRRDVNTIDDLEKALKKGKGKKTVLLLIRTPRGDQILFLTRE